MRRLLVVASLIHLSQLSAAEDRPLPAAMAAFLEAHCTGCHGEQKKGGLDLAALPFQPEQPRNLEAWVKVFDRVATGEMPPKKALDPAERRPVTETLAAALLAAEQGRAARDGRSARRRLNRGEYENVLRDLLQVPWLEIEDALPEDGVAFRFNKSAEALDVSHVQVARYLAAAEAALRLATAAAPQRPPTLTTRHYARDQSSFTDKMFYNPFNNSPERATFPVHGYKGQPGVRRKTAPMVDPKSREYEGVGLVCGAYEPVEPKFNRFTAPVAGRYKLRFRTHTAWVGPNGSAGKTTKWSIPDLDTVSKGRRPEPVVVYAVTPPRQLRRLGAFDADPEPGTQELDTFLLAGETIRPDAARLFRSRPGEVRFQNPLAEFDGQPAVVYRWMDVEGPVFDMWPPYGHQLLFGDLPLKPAATPGGPVVVVSGARTRTRRRC